MKRELKNINVLQAGFLLAILYGMGGLLIGLIYGLMFMVFGAVGGVAGSSSMSGGPSGGQMVAVMGGLGLMMVILIPVFYGAIGFVSGIIGSALYNLAAKWVGGLKFEVVDVGPTPGYQEG